MKKINLLLLFLTITSLTFSMGCSSGAAADANKYEIVKTGKEGVLVMDKQTSELFTYQKGSWASLGKSDKAKSCNVGKFTYISQKANNRHLILDQKIGEVLAYKDGKWQSLGAPVSAGACNDNHNFAAISKDGSGLVLFDQISGDVFRFQKEAWAKVGNPAKGTKSKKSVTKMKPSKKGSKKSTTTEINENDETKIDEVELNETIEAEGEADDFEFDTE
ncbi:MAG: hypothetical protein ACPG5B_08620 [Chitinophagales bacterium]